MHNSKSHYDAVTLDMGFTLVNMDGRYDRLLLQMAHDAGYGITLADIRAATRAHWQKQDGLDAVRTWEPSVEADAAIGYEIDRSICAHLGITDAAFLAALGQRARNNFEDPSTYTVFPDVFDALAALRRLNGPSRDIKPAGPCAGCRDNFPLPAAADVFDGMVVDGYLARRKACALCPEGAKPCLPGGRA